jgi:hypothetical protein
MDFDNISIKLADTDRSVNNNGLTVNGTITRSPVATGADLVAYSGFSETNHLEQPYNPDLDFGTSDFCYMWWGRSGSASDVWFDRYNGSGARLLAWLDASGYISILNGSETFTGSVNYADGVRRHFAAVRNSGVLYVYVNGVLVGSTAFPSSVDTTSPLVIGQYYTNAPGGSLTNGDIALLRISATAPTAEQIAKIYNDEKVLLQENAACTLYGASDAVTALAHDAETGLLHVGTSAGRSVFDGLERVGNTTTSVSTAISASGGLIVEK